MGVLIIHRDIDGFNHSDGEFCACEPFVYPEDTLLTPEQVVYEASVKDFRN